MKQRRAVPTAFLLASTALAGCGGDALPGTLLGSYTRVEADPSGARMSTRELNVTATGLTLTGAGAGSALFEKVRCTDDTTCRFTTKSGCEGTITREPSGAIVIVAVGDCDGSSGRWTPAGAAPPAATTAAPAEPSSASAPPAAPPTAPKPAATATATATATSTATATATGTATAAPSASGTATAGPIKVSCVAACNDTNLACIRECKVGDLECIRVCSTKMAECAKKCQ
jgi:hypothetical protein